MAVRWKVFFFPHHRISQISNQDALEALVGAFCKWGCPKRLRVDNGEPLASPLPSTTSAFALCMIAYGITVHTNRPGVPQENGKVERQQGTSMRWAEIKKCQTLQEAQEKLNQAIIIQREQYPVSRLKGQTRVQAFPQLLEKQRNWEQTTFDAQRVYEFLAQKQYVRKVSRSGQITHFNHQPHISSDYKGQSICLKFNSFTLKWEIYSANGDFIKSINAEYLSAERIKNMTVYSKNYNNGA